MSDRAEPRTRRPPVLIAQLAWGGLLLARPEAALGPPPSDPAPDPQALRLGARVLGIRHVTQGLALAGWPGRRSRRISVLTDLAHASSMGLLAAARPAYRPAALRSLTASALLALLTPLPGLAIETAGRRKR